MNNWKKWVIFISVIVAAGFILCIVPLGVSITTSVHLLNVDTESQWISFWGNYLGALLGGGISGTITLYVLIKTLKDNENSLKLTFENNKKEETRKEIVDFCNYLISKKADFAQKYESSVYKAQEVLIYKNSELDEEKQLDKHMEFVEIQHSGKVVLCEIVEQINVRKNDARYCTQSSKDVVDIANETYEKFKKFESDVAYANGEEDNEKVTKDLIYLVEKCLEDITVYVTELLDKEF